MRSILLAAMASMITALLLTPLIIRSFRARGLGQHLREDWADRGGHHEQKRGTPTMGGVVIIGAVVIGYLIAHLGSGWNRFGWSGLLVVGAMVSMGALGFIDDFMKIRRERSLGLNKTAKLVGQAVVAVGFAWSVSANADAPTTLAFIRSTTIDLGPFFFLWVFIVFSATSNGVNLTDGLDGLAAGSSALVLAAYTFITFWQFRHSCVDFPNLSGCYANIPDPLDLAVVSAAGLGACAGFLWWNAAPARIFMGDTGALALGGGLAALAILSSTDLLLVVLGGLFVLETTSVIIQVIAFRGFKRRVFRMAPLHHHFELGGWPEFTVIVRFWILAGIAAGLGLGIFYAEFIARGGSL
jgi:phospho-N-acetylmuramoyl-pentapeptide-transferase